MNPITNNPVTNNQSTQNSLPVNHLQRAPATLLQQDIATCEMLADVAFVEMADGEQFQATVVTDFKTVFQRFYKFFQLVFRVVDANGKADGGVLHQVHLDVQLVESSEKSLQLSFGDEGKIPRRK